MEDARIAKGAFRIGIYGVLRDKGMVLLTRTRTRSGLIWNFPGGALDYGESPEECLRREFREETGLAIAIGQVAYLCRHAHFATDYANEQLFYAYFDVSLASDERTVACGKDVVENKWHELSDLPLREMNAPDREFCEWLAFRAKEMVS